MIKNITVMWISLLLLKKELKKFVIVYFFDVVSVKEPKKIWKKCPKMLFVTGSFLFKFLWNQTLGFFCISLCIIFFWYIFFTKDNFCWAYSMQYYTTIQKKKKIALFFPYNFSTLYSLIPFFPSFFWNKIKSWVVDPFFQALFSAIFAA